MALPSAPRARWAQGSPHPLLCGVARGDCDAHHAARSFPGERGLGAGGIGRAAGLAAGLLRNALRRFARTPRARRRAVANTRNNGPSLLLFGQSFVISGLSALKPREAR